MRLRLLCIVIMLFTLSACSLSATPTPDIPATEQAITSKLIATMTAQAPEPTPTPALCRDINADYISEIDKLITKWDDANQLAGSTSRITLSGPVSKLQEVRQTAADLKPTDCAAKTHAVMLSYMDNIINMYMAFMKDQAGTQDEYEFLADQDLTDWGNKYFALKQGLPIPLRKYQVIFYVTTSVKRELNVTLLAPGNKEISEVKEIPFSTDLYEYSEGETARITIENGTAGGNINCLIKVNGRELVKETASGPNIKGVCEIKF